ncbi:NAD-dependent epimerase/dehydratase family protein [Desulfurivibrio sp. D14AmB]|uniref:NAD-dependent epimerase/dehydratase family protein n=1 Tax=Desulfurivibrio sp. D14AmB TaxID=3374370 RepID=UPI00376F3D86
MKILVTGATGLVGGALLLHLLDSGHEVRAALRGDGGGVAPGCQPVRVGEIGPETAWGEALAGVEAVVHAAGCVHGGGTKSEFAHRARCLAVNVDGTINLARQAVAAGVRRFVFVSTIKVNGEFSEKGRPFTAEDLPRPVGAYALSKQAAETGLRRLAGESGLEVVIVRPPLVYGPGVKANFQTMMRWLKWGVPLPFGAIDNRRSLVALDNLVDLLGLCLVHPAVAGQIILAADGEDLSTSQLLRRLAGAMGKRALLVPVPANIVAAGMGLCGLGDEARRLCADLQVDIGPTTALLGWRPPVSLHTALHKTVRHYLQSS